MQAPGKVHLENVCTLIHFFLRATRVSNKSLGKVYVIDYIYKSIINGGYM